jgi:U1 zinc finger
MLLQPKYWCKNCSTYVRDTPFERRQHENTAKHQNNLKRFLRDIQNSHERTERDKQRAKDEVERLNKVTGNPTANLATQIAASVAAGRPPSLSTLSTADRQRQWSQLAAMGIQVPNTHNGELAMASEWKAAPKQSTEDVPAQNSLSKGIRKRRLDDEDEEEAPGRKEHNVRSAPKIWGKTTKIYPGQDNSDLDSLLSIPLSLKKEKAEFTNEDVSVSRLVQVATSASAAKSNAAPKHDSRVGASPDIDTQVSIVSPLLSERADSSADQLNGESNSLVKSESVDSHGETVIDRSTTNPVFKKRKSKPASTAIQYSAPSRIL